jgi:hypothetical protein
MARMRAPRRIQHHAFRRLEGALMRRRLLQLDPRLRIELAVLGLLIAGFLFWQVRVPLDGVVRARGPAAGVGVLAGAAAVLALGSALLAGIHHARRLRAGPAGPEWLALPLERDALARHLAWESRGRALWLAVPSLGVLAAAVGLVPAGWIALFAAGFAGLSRVAADLGCLIGDRVARRAVAARSGVHPLDALLAVAAPRARRRRFAAATWRRVPAWAALAAKDLLVTWRRGSTRRTAAMPLLLGVAALLAWRLPGEPALRHFASFTLVLLAAAALAEWLVVLAGSDPFAALRVLPVGVITVWGARFVWAAVAALALVAGLAVAARELAPHALQLFLAWSAAATVAIATLGVNYGVTLFPRADLAQRLLGLSLGLAVATSVMLPLSGWIVLLTAVLHSARRLPRWSRLEEA